MKKIHGRRHFFIYNQNVHIAENRSVYTGRVTEISVVGWPPTSSYGNGQNGPKDMWPKKILHVIKLGKGGLTPPPLYGNYFRYWCDMTQTQAPFTIYVIPILLILVAKHKGDLSTLQHWSQKGGIQRGGAICTPPPLTQTRIIMYIQGHDEKI